MSHPDPPSPAESHRRRLVQFSRWLTAAQQSPPEHREAIVYLAARIDIGGMSKADMLAAIDSLDELLAEVWDRRPGEED